ncbi:MULTISPECIES: hypothetical protein [Pseudanabaena]|uniref:Uncharacterized protein n=2 Tax=Pseudanabaena TaxID=1152 RepID=L8N0G2_9CYAN|nr:MULTISPECIES: hypothetical protein [Pseudanabaena]ELS32220.1 hypothetical protein Pse7429DRAFT_2548 [Pseudanabaena biceps PCC 7429]MDG3495558.1 hypothetical protein [Pseudanabaena catenata USMAC16]
MYQIDWGASVKHCPYPQEQPQSQAPIPKHQVKNRLLALASCLTLQIATLVMSPLLVAAESISPNTSSNTPPSVQEDSPEEVLRAEIYTDARSPIDGKQLSAAEYTELMEKLRSLDNIPPEDLVSPKVREVIGLLKLRKFLKQFIPFVP